MKLASRGLPFIVIIGFLLVISTISVQTSDMRVILNITSGNFR
jgi:hypothetical protein